MKGRLMSVDIVPESSIFAFSAASFRRWSAIGSFERSMPWSRLNSPTIQSITRWSKSSPPRWVSPFVDLTSNCREPLRHGGPKRVLGGLLHFLANHRRDLGGRVPLALHLDRGDIVRSGDDLVGNALNLLGHFGHLAAHEALDREDCILRIGDRLT